MLGRLARSSYCKDPRDRIYSVLAISCHETAFRVDYSETKIDTFPRLADFFSGWAYLCRLPALWLALALTSEEIRNAELEGKTLQCSIAIRCYKPVKSFNTRLKNLLSSRRPIFL